MNQSSITHATHERRKHHPHTSSHLHQRTAIQPRLAGNPLPSEIRGRPKDGLTQSQHLWPIHLHGERPSSPSTSTTSSPSSTMTSPFQFPFPFPENPVPNDRSDFNFRRQPMERNGSNFDHGQRQAAVLDGCPPPPTNGPDQQATETGR